MARHEIVPSRPTHFPASEPYTILGLDPEDAYAAVNESASTKVELWSKVLVDHVEYARELSSLKHAVQILGNRESFFRYRSFVRKVYDPSRKEITSSRIQRMFAAAVVNCVPDLREQDTIRDIQAGSIFGLSVLIGLMLLIAVITIPVGGVVVFGTAFFAKTLLVAWGPWAILPALAVVAVGGAAVYWYREHRDVFDQLHVGLGKAMDQVEALAVALEDVFLLRGFQLFEKDAAQFRAWRKVADKERDSLVADFIKSYVRVFVDRLSSLIVGVEGSKKMGPEEFFSFLSEHPREVQACFLTSLYDLVSRQQSDWPAVEFHPSDTIAPDLLNAADV